MGRSKREVALPPPPSPSQASPGSFASGMMLPGSLGSGAWQGPAPLQPPHPLLYAYGAAASAFPMAQMKQGLDRSAIDLSDLQERGMDFHPPGGFLSYFQDPSILQNHRPFVPPNYYPAEQVAPCSKLHPGAQQPVNIDSGDEEAPNVRTEKRLTWSTEEDIRLVSAWLNNSNDSISGNFKKNDCYWGDVTAEYNSTTPKNRTREKAEAAYQADYKEGPFSFLHCWNILRDQPKWHAYLEELEKPNKPKMDDEVEVMEQMSTPNSPEDIKRPVGTKTAKAQRNGKGKRKRKAKVYLSDTDDEIDKLKEVQEMANKGRDELLETQRHVASDNLESKKLAHLAAMEHKEAVMLETYRSLMLQDTKDMPDDVRSEHLMALKCMREKLFP
ncbi:hypothetical protein DAI22_01g193100 [Oryza sativa Japonica Group]|nr:hypothetical protein DAI22_01g193100 [Oryza sativa Japonica Group]